MLNEEFNYYLEHQSDLVKAHEGKFLVIKGQKVQGAYNSKMQAYEEGKKSHELGTFLIQYCAAGQEAYTATYHSRVNFG